MAQTRVFSDVFQYYGKWFNNEDFNFLAEQQEKFKNAKLDSTLIRKKRVVTHLQINESKVSYSHLSYPLFNKTYDTCLILAGYDMNELATGSAMYIFKKIDGAWIKVEVFGVSMS